MQALNLRKEEALVLTKDNGENLTNIPLGLGWSTSRIVTEKQGGFLGFFAKTVDKVVPGRSIDLDSSVLVFDENKKCIDTVYFGKLNGKGIKHLGDDRTGRDKKSATDNEQILIDLTKVDPKAKYLVFTINSFTGETFKQVDKSYCRILDNDKEKVRIELAEQGDYTAVILAKVTKENGKWEIKNVSKTGNARTADRLIPLAQSIL